VPSPSTEPSLAATPEPTPAPSPSPATAAPSVEPVPSATNDGTAADAAGALPPGGTYRIQDPPSSQGLFETIVGGVAGFFFGG